MNSRKLSTKDFIVAAILLLILFAGLWTAYSDIGGPKETEAPQAASPIPTTTPAELVKTSSPEPIKVGLLDVRMEEIRYGYSNTRELRLYAPAGTKVDLIEIIPKSLARKASYFTQSAGFAEVLLEDPVVVVSNSFEDVTEYKNVLNFPNTNADPVVFLVVAPEWRASGDLPKLASLLNQLVLSDLNRVKPFEIELSNLLNDEAYTREERIENARERMLQAGVINQSDAMETIVAYVSAFAPFSSVEYTIPRANRKELGTVLYQSSGAQDAFSAEYLNSSEAAHLLLSVDLRKLPKTSIQSVLSTSIYAEKLILSFAKEPEKTYNAPLTTVVLLQPVSTNIKAYAYQLNLPGKYFVFNGLPYDYEQEDVTLPAGKLIEIDANEYRMIRGDAAPLQGPIAGSQEQFERIILERASTLTDKINAQSSSQKEFAMRHGVAFTEEFPVLIDLVTGTQPDYKMTERSLSETQKLPEGFEGKFRFSKNVDVTVVRMELKLKQ